MLTASLVLVQNEAALEAEVAGLWARLNQQGSTLAAAQQEQHSALGNAAERESELLAQLDAASLKLQVGTLPCMSRSLEPAALIKK